MNSVNLKRGNAKGRLTRAGAFADNVGPEITIETLEIRLEKLDTTWSEFSALHNECLEKASEENCSELESEFVEYEEKYFSAYAKLKRSIRERQSVDRETSAIEKLAEQQSSFLDQLSASSESCSSVQLPKLIVPTFSGNYKDWPSFRDSFMGTVDTQKKLSGTQKFHYLKSFLRDDAANLVKHLPVSEANYTEAWDRLESRYDRVHLIVQSYIQTFLSLPSVSSGNVHSLRKVADGADEVVRGLNALNANDRDPWLIYLLLSKLDDDTKQRWADHVRSRDDCAFSELLSFLEARCDALESCQSLSRTSVSRNKPQATARTHFAESSQSTTSCPKCKEGHLLSQCPSFTSLNIESRRSFVKQNSLCFNCLRVGHSANKCRSSFRCRVCKSRHHSMVHSEEQDRSSVPSTSTSCFQPRPTSLNQCHPAPVPQPVTNHSSLLDVGLHRQTILPTVMATVQDNSGISIMCRVLIDSGSQLSFIGESFAQRLGLPRKHARIPVLGLSSTDAGQTRGCMSIHLRSRFNKAHVLVDAFVINKLTSNLPSESFDVSDWSHLKNLDLADPNFNSSGPIDMLLGADKLWCILRGNQILGLDGLPVAQETTFGWVVSGQLLDTKQQQQTPVSSLHSALDVDVLLQRFWELDEVTPLTDGSLEDEAETHFRKTFSRAADGRYVVQLPFTTPTPSFGSSLNNAVSRLTSMERRFKKDPNLHEMYVKFMQEYVNLGHMVPIPPSEVPVSPGQCFYLPHHAVLKSYDSSTKLRVVFDGSAKDSLGDSLNSRLLVGPPIQRDLLGVCLRFRQHKYVFTADVVKMFRQIWVDNLHRDFQRIVWRNKPSDDISHFRLCTVTYGTASAPFLAVRVLKQIAADYQTQYPNAARVLLNDVYVDDVMTGADSADALVHLQSELVSLLSNAKLELGKWNSNCWPLRMSLCQNDCSFSNSDTEHSQSMIKVLGMYWHPISDNYSFRTASSRLFTTPTRRSLLSEISRIFDPLGFLAPSVILFKMLFQELWSSELKLGWDDPLPLQLADKWLHYQEELHYFEKIQVPRFVFTLSGDIELHGFSDASTGAYSAVVYARCRTTHNQFQVVLIAAKTKVAPIKPVSIPRLELCGALLLSRLLAQIKSSISKNFRVFAWCDSQIVLHWLSSSPRRWTTFIANRTAAILETIPRYAWHHIASESNPADCASRGVIPSKLKTHPLWWSGPPFLLLPQELWPVSTFSVTPPDEEEATLEEKTRPKQTLIATAEMDVINVLVSKVSSWTRLLRIVAYCVRFTRNCRPTRNNKQLARGLTYSELQFAEIQLLKSAQRDTFASEICNLTNNRDINHKSKLVKYAPFLDKDGILRVGGRIKHAVLSFNLKHPILLPNNRLSSLLVNYLHIKYLHPGVSDTFAIVRQRYWILGSRNLIRKIVHQCKSCFRQRRLTSTQLMGDLPSERVRPSRPFFNSGCDYAGPFTIKLSRGRNPKFSKAYLALFVCMSTKAIHLELVSDLTTDAFLAALRRSVARRGRCANIYTDNGTNFQGARRILNEMQRFVWSKTHNDDITNAVAMDGITWHFIPPSAPHFGGLWEGGVKSVKLHLRRVIGSSILTFEELYTVFTQIEAVLNSRPLCVLSDEDLNPLTPSHFLIGEPHTAIPEPSYLGVPTNRLSHWKHIQSMVQGFWKRWQNEYITSLQVRPKWKTAQPNIQVGDLVVVKESNLPPSKWLLGRVDAVHPGPDNRTRVATLRTTRGQLVRPITKLAPLPMS